MARISRSLAASTCPAVILAPGVKLPAGTRFPAALNGPAVSGGGGGSPAAAWQESSSVRLHSATDDGNACGRPPSPSRSCPSMLVRDRVLANGRSLPSRSMNSTNGSGHFRAQSRSPRRTRWPGGARARGPGHPARREPPVPRRAADRAEHDVAGGPRAAPGYRALVIREPQRDVPAPGGQVAGERG
jgi:hypothetical protein